MRITSSLAEKPGDFAFRGDLEAAALRLREGLRRLDLSLVGISPYMQRYASAQLAYLDRNIRLYSHLLSLSLSGIRKRPADVVLVDYGAGPGLMSLLAKQLGVGCVVYNDIYDVACDDAKTLAHTVGAVADHYVLGELAEVRQALEENRLVCDAIASYDVIEHVYDVRAFFESLTRLASGPMTVVMSTGANSFNPIITRRLMKRHAEVEHHDRTNEWGHKERDTLRAYSQVRREMILTRLRTRRYAGSLAAAELAQLVLLTRGMRESDIAMCVDQYVEHRQLPPEPNHPTNTCDPYTGNGAENLVDFFELAGILQRAGFDAAILPGCSHRRWIGPPLNWLINAGGLRLAPYVTIYAQRS